MLQAFWTKKIGIIKTRKNCFGDYSQIWKNKYSSRKFEIHRHHNLSLRLCWLENFMWKWILMSFCSFVMRYLGRLFIRRWEVFALDNFKFLVQIMTNSTAAFMINPLIKAIVVSYLKKIRFSPLNPYKWVKRVRYKKIRFKGNYSIKFLKSFPKYLERKLQIKSP